MRTFGGVAAILGHLHPFSREEPGSASIATGLASLDGLAPHGGFVRGAVHEIISAADAHSFLLPAILARAAAKLGWVVWCDGAGELFPPGLALLGVPLDRVLVLRSSDELWAAAECLRCPAVAVCVAALPRLSRVQARRIQLAAERGGGVGILLRPRQAVSWPYAAATRWLVAPERGKRNIQRWRIQLLHGHGGQAGQSILLEMCRETNLVRAVEDVERQQRLCLPAGA
jgi:protein ImuA